MLDASNEPGEDAPAAARPTGRRRWQVGLRTLVLLTAVIAAWMAYFFNKRQNAALAAQIEALVPLARDLVVNDPKQIAVVKLDDLWRQEDRWEIYLPDGRYRLRLATHGIGAEGYAEVSEGAALSAGRHRLVVVQRSDGDASRVTARWDGTELIEKKEPAGWHSGNSLTTGGDYSVSEQLPPEGPLLLLRRRFLAPKGAIAAPGDGVLLWIERTPGTDAKP